MCGIVGLLLKKPALEARLGELMVPMLVGMTERGPDSAGLAVFSAPSRHGVKLSLFGTRGTPACIKPRANPTRPSPLISRPNAVWQALRTTRSADRRS